MEKICIVDDYEINLFVLKEYLYEFYEVVTFSSAISCIEYLKSNDIKVVLMDCMMPDMDGYQASSIITRDFPYTCVVGVTASPFEENIKKCYEFGMVDVISKPIDRLKLLEIINKLYKRT